MLVSNKKNNEIMPLTATWMNLNMAIQYTTVVLPGESPWTEEPGWLQSMGSQRVRHDLATKTPFTYLYIYLLAYT